MPCKLYYSEINSQRPISDRMNYLVSHTHTLSVISIARCSRIYKYLLSVRCTQRSNRNKSILYPPVPLHSIQSSVKPVVRIIFESFSNRFISMNIKYTCDIACCYACLSSILFVGGILQLKWNEIKRTTREMHLLSANDE